MAKENDLRVWWIPQVPLKKGETSFRVLVKDMDEAKKVYDVLAEYDQYQFDHKIKPDYSNVGGYEIFLDGEWQDYEMEEE